MRSTVADYEVIRAVDPDPTGGARYLCRPPDRLGWSEPEVMVTEVPWSDPGRSAPSEVLAGFAAAGSDHLISLIEAGPDEEPGGRGGYLATESTPLGHLADRAPIRSRSEAAALVADGAAGAHALHEAGLAHGAISPKSIFVTNRGGVLGPPRLAPHPGLAAAVNAWQDLVILDPDVLLGEAPSRTSDIWALGATLHLILSSRPLYPGLDTDQPVTAVQRVLFTRPEIDPALPDRLVEVIRACLDPDPANRPPTADDLARALASQRTKR